MQKFSYFGFPETSRICIHNRWSAGLECELIQNSAGAEIRLLSRGLFLRRLRYFLAIRLPNPQMGSGCESGGALLHVSLESIRS